MPVISSTGYSPTWPGGVKLGAHRVKPLLNGTATGSAVPWGGGRGVVSAICATWNSATATLEMRGPDDSTWISLGSDATLDANGAFEFELPVCHIRLAISGTPSAAVVANAEIVKL